jgi:hypothetical protein
MLLNAPLPPAGPAILFWAGDGVYGLPGPKLPITIAPPGTVPGSVPPATLPLLTALSKSGIASYAAFVRAETHVQASRGTDFVIGDPRREPDLLDPAFLGDALLFDLKGNGQLERASLIGVRYPGVDGASAGSEDLVVAPLADGTWRVWVR